MNTGVYIIRNFYGGEEYIGSTTTSFRQRWKCHINALKRGGHENFLLQAAWDFFGESALMFRVLDRVPAAQCEEVENKWIAVLQPEYNLKRKAIIPGHGRRHSLESRKKRSARITGEGNPFFGRKHSAETLTHFRAVKLGKVTSEETKKKLSEASKKAQASPEYRAKMAATIKAWWDAGRPSPKKQLTP